MKFFLLLVCSLLLASVSCKKNDRITVLRDSANVTLHVNETYKFDLGYPCDECGTRISKQANHYSISAISIKPDTPGLHYFYEYAPVLNYTGMDEAEIELSSGSDGASPNTNFFYKTIKFTITN